MLIQQLLLNQMKPNKIILCATIGSIFWAGCSSLKTETTKIYIDPKLQTEVREDTLTKVRTFFDAKSGLANLKNSITPQTSGATIGNLNQESSGSNSVQTLKIIFEGGKGFVTP